MDETNIHENITHTHGLSVAGTNAHLLVDKTGNYVPRYDVMAAISLDSPLAFKSFRPDERNHAETKGINKEMFLDWISDELTTSINKLPSRDYYLITDNARIHNASEILDEFYNMNDCPRLKEAILHPPNTAKYLSPLDNNYWHYWKEEVRKNEKRQEEPMNDFLLRCWEHTDSSFIRSSFRKCRLMRGQSIDDDLI